MFDIYFDAPSMKPGSEYLAVAWLITSFGCSKNISRVIDESILERTFYSSTGKETPISNIAEFPTVFPVALVQDTHLYTLRVKNNSLDKIIKNTNDTRINFVFLNSLNKPVYAMTGRVTGSVPSGGEAILSAYSFEIGYLKPPVSATKVEGSLIFALCKGWDCSY